MALVLLVREGGHKISMGEHTRSNQNLPKPTIFPPLSGLRLDEQRGLQLSGGDQARMNQQFAQARRRAADRSRLAIELLEHEHRHQRLGGQQPLLHEQVAEGNRPRIHNALVLLRQCCREIRLSQQPLGTQVITEPARLSMHTRGQERTKRKSRVGRDGQRTEIGLEYTPPLCGGCAVR